MSSQTSNKRRVKIGKLEAFNMNLKLLAIIFSLTIILSSLSILNFRSVYSQSSEDAKSLNCKDNADQSQYVTNVAMQNKSSGSGLLQTIFQDFIMLKNSLIMVH
jgi:hypothetical protein